MAMTIDRYDNQCALCRVSEATKTGSHIVPNFLIHSMFSFDGKGKRDREIAVRECLNQKGINVYYGPQVSPEAIEADHGVPLTDEELEKNTNNLEIDFLFCPNCENRFGILETEYAQFYKNESYAINPRVAYLFWLSVFWRMTIGRSCIFMRGEDEFEIRRILNENITSIQDISKSEVDLGDFGYVVWRTKGLIKGDSGIFGTRTQHAPYLIIVNDLVVLLVNKVSKLRKDFPYAGWIICLDSINTYKDEDVYVTEISNEDFARFKDFIVEESQEVGWGKNREAVQVDIREQERTKGKLHCVADERQRLVLAREIDNLEGKPKFRFRNARRFQIARWKEHCAERLGVEYDLLKDRTLFLFPYQLENYVADLKKAAKAGQDVSWLPYFEKYLSERYWKGKENYQVQQEMYEEQTKSALEHGFTYEDIIYRNCMTWRSE